jgi:hypothetical protein
MRTIAGQINGFNFQSVSRGVSDPTLGNDVEAIFKRDWGSQIGHATEATNLAGNEHLGATFGSVAPLPDLAVDLPLPPGAVCGFAYSIDAVVERVLGIWDYITAQGNRIDTNGNPDYNGPIELQTISIATSGDTWKTTVNGFYHTPDRVPNVPFTITQSESLNASGYAVPASFSLSYSSSATIHVDTSSLDRALTTLEVFGGWALVGVAGFLGVPLAAFSASILNAKITSTLQPLAVPTIDIVAKSIPQRTRLPGTTDNLWLHFDTVSFPQGTVATIGNGGLTSLMPGTAIVLSGRLAPTRARREGFVTVTGPEVLELPPRIIGHPLPSPPTVEGTYAAFTSDETVNPSFTWEVTDVHGHPLAAAALSSTTGPSVTVAFSGKGVTPSTPLYAGVGVTMHDDLGLKDDQGKTPTGGAGVIVKIPPPIPPPKPSGPPPLQPLEP